MSAHKAKPSDRFIFLQKICKKPLFAKIYRATSASVLVATTCYWALLGARVQASNADQSANIFLLEHSHTFSTSILPSQHTFLFKWPIFLLIRLFGSTNFVFTVATIGVTLLTVGALAYIMYRIERRPLVFGTMCLALASVLLLVPAQPYPGGILPVNMAMVTTRNLEYIVFIVSLILLAQSGRWRSWRFASAGLLMALLIASDKLFLTVSVGGALLGMAFYTTVRKWSLVKLSAMWLTATIAAAVLAAGVIWLINTTGMTHIADSNTITGPYGFAHTGRELALGAVYVLLSLLTNFGANPAADTRLLGHLPSQIVANFTSIHVVSFALNIAIASIGMIIIGRLILTSTKQEKIKKITKKKKKQLAKVNPFGSVSLNISIMLIWSTVAACGAFIVSNHYYPVDARYVGIALFTLFISLATFARSQRFRRPEMLVVIGAIILISIPIGIGVAKSNYHDEKTAMADTDKRNSFVLSVLNHHPVDLLVGDYWRVFPIKVRAKTHASVTPLSGCVQNRDVLSSRDWQLDLHQHSFAYILTLDQSLTGYPPCTLKQIVSKYGLPNASVLLAGTHNQPKELLLLYDKGSHRSVPKTKTSAPSAPPATVTPVAIAGVPHADCPDLKPTVMNIVAHQDDDLLFMNPDVLHDIQMNYCVRTVYVTSGDAGADKYYWLSRERGSEAAYNNMAGLSQDTTWIQRIVELPDGQFITVANPQGNAKISLTFMHLPDGNVGGQGFESSHYESLSRLEHGQISDIHALDHQSTYSSGQVTDALTTLLQTYRPNQIRTQANVIDHRYTDHSDHMAVGRYVKQAYSRYTEDLNVNPETLPLLFYIGYPIHGLPGNVEGDDLARKERIFFDYAHYDDAVCSSAELCAQGTVYDAYLQRQYQSDH